MTSWVAALAMAVSLAGPAAAVQDYRFRETAAPPGPVIGPDVLAEADRAFIAALPELRVGVPARASAPYETIEGSEVSGIHPELLQAVGRIFGLRMRPVVLPDWPAVLQAARRREVDLVMTLGVTAERLEYLEFTLGATPMPGALFSRPGVDGSDPSRSRFVLEREFLANDFVRRQFPEATILTVETTGDALRAVAQGQADFYLGSLLESTEWIARESISQVEVNRLMPYGTGYYHFGVRKDWAPLARILNQGIQALRSGSPPVPLRSEALAAWPGATPATLPIRDADERAALASRAVWRVGAVRGLALLNDVDERLLHSGIAAEYCEQVARRLGVAIQVVGFANVGAMLDALRRGEIDVVPFLTRTPERARQLAYTAPYLEMPYVLVARSDAPLYWGLQSLHGRRLALAAEHPLRDLLPRLAPGIVVVDAADGNQAMDLVARGQADAAVEVKLFANLRINSDPTARLRSLGEVAELPARFHFATSEASRPLVPLIDRALADIPDAERTRMLRRWVAIDLQRGFHWRNHLFEILVAAAALLLLAAITLWWMRRLAREVRQRRRSEQLLNDIATTVPGLAFRYVLGPDGSIRHHFFTPGAKAFLGVDLAPDKTVLASIADRLSPQDYTEAMAVQAESKRSGAPFKMSLAYDHPDGRQRWLLAEAVQTRSHDDSAVWTGYVVDVTTERELMSRLAREADTRNLLLASASHELRAPTHTLTLALAAMPRQGLSAEQHEALGMAGASARTLSQLLGDVLDAARSDIDSLSVRPQTVALHPLFGEIAAAWRAAALSKGLRFEHHVDPSVPRSASLDPLRLKQVLTNLLSNACKYTAGGSVGFEVDLDADAALRVRISDTGIGIAEEERLRLFKPFGTVGNGPAVPEGRTGLGLANCARLMSAMGGEIGLDSRPGVGTTVTVRLPLKAAAWALPAEPSGGGRKVVVCDDDETSRLLTTLMLRRIGFEVEDTDDGRQALEAWRRGDVRAVVSDLDMPGLSGAELMRMLRAEEGDAPTRTAIIVCSGNVLTESAGGEVPYDAYLVKPVQIETLVETLSALGLRP